MLKNRTIPNDKMESIIRDNEQCTFTLIYAAISEEKNVVEKEAETILKYKDITL